MSKNNVIPFGGVTRLDLPADKVLEGAKGQMKGVIIIGFDKEDELYTASSYADGGDIIWLLEACKQRLFNNLALSDI